MISVIIETANDEAGLAHLLATLVPSATEGVVKDVTVIDHGSADGTLKVADVAGCMIVKADRDPAGALQSAVLGARGDWLLFLPPRPDALGREWQREALAFVDHAMVSGTAGTASAMLSRGRVRSGRLNLLRALFRDPTRGELIAKDAWLSAHRASARLAASNASGARQAGA